jgi:hypothetical protein
MQIVAEEIGGMTYAIGYSPEGMVIGVGTKEYGPVPFMKVREALDAMREHNDPFEFIQAFCLDGVLEAGEERKLAALAEGALEFFERHPPKSAH